MDKSKKLKTIRQFERLIGRELTSIPSAEIMNASKNSFSTDSKGNVSGLNLAGTGITDLSFLYKLKNIVDLNLSHNRVSDISPLKGLEQLNRIDLTFNRISQIPAAFSDFKPGIKWGSKNEEMGIFLEGNPLEVPPAEIVKQGKEAVENYLKNEIDRSSAYFLPIKMVILGDEGTGKTSVLKKLINPDWQPEPVIKEVTPGIEVTPWEFNCRFYDNIEEKVLVHAWDFDREMMACGAYRPFITIGALYILVWEAGGNGASRLDSWLHTIRHFSAASPVIVIMNKADAQMEYIDKATLAERYDNIVDFIEFSSITGKGLSLLTGQIRTVLKNMPQRSEPFPAGMAELLGNLSIEKQESPSIGIDNYLSMSKKYGFSEYRAVFFLQYLCYAGIILHLSHDQFLQNILFLDPQWITGAIRVLLNPQEIQLNKGCFNSNDMDRLLPKPGYPRQIHQVLVRLMENSGLCFNIAGTGRYIVQALPDNELPPFDDNKDNKQPGILHFHYHYRSRFDLIIPRLTARIFHLVKDNRFGKNWVDVEYENSTARVLTDLTGKKIKISVNGFFKSELLAIIKNNVEDIHFSMDLEKEKDYEEMVPCPCSRCSNSEEPNYYPYDLLAGALNNETGASVICPLSMENIKIELLLKGVEVPRPESELLKQIMETKGKELPFFKPVKGYRKKVMSAAKKSHFSTLSIKKYKALENFELKYLNRINFIAGVNNSGKSSLLEAVYLLSSLNDIYAFFEIQGIRGKFYKGLDAAWIDDQFLGDIEIGGVFDNRSASIRITREIDDIKSTDKNPYLSTIAINARLNNDLFTGSARLFLESTPEYAIRDVGNLCNSVFSSPFSLQNREDVVLFHEDSVRAGSKPKIIEFLKKHVDPDIEDIEFVGGPNNNFMVTHKKFTKPVYLTQFGDGMQRIFYLALQFASAENGVLLIDELENAIHYELLRSFSEFISLLSRQFNTQVFITSHSKECIDAFFKDESQNIDISAYLLIIEGNQIKSKFLSGPKYAQLLETIDLDIRGKR